MRTATAVAALVAALTPPAAGQVNCSTREHVVGVLEEKYEESRRAYGVVNPGQVLELFASERGTWTALITTTDGRSCVVASGDDWVGLPPPPPGEPT